MEHCGCRFKCSQNIDETGQKALFDDYWKLPSMAATRTFLSPFVIEKSIMRERPRKNDDKKKKKSSRYYYLPHNGDRVRVCQKFFCFVFSILFRTVECFLSKRTPTGAVIHAEHGLTGRPPHNITSPTKIAEVRKHIDLFPRMESHYCRKDSKRLYLAADLNITMMYRLYKKWCTERNSDCVSDAVHHKVFNSCERMSSL